MAPMARLRKADCSGPGIRRRRRGKGCEYFHDSGRKIKDAEVLRRIDELRIPPAWEEVWICPHPMGHLQAVGTDAAGRRQYLYHPRWRKRRDREKYDRVIRFARALPRLRDRCQRLRIVHAGGLLEWDPQRPRALGHRWRGEPAAAPPWAVRAGEGPWRRQAAVRAQS